MKRIISLLLAAGCTVIGGLSAPNVARAVDTEVFFGRVTEGEPPNILFILDTSRSMFSLESSPTESYDPTLAYGGSCTGEDFYFYPGATVPASLTCSGANRIPRDALRCPTVISGIDRIGGGFAPAVTQSWLDNKTWRSVASRQYNGNDVYCQGETGLPGGISFPTNGNPVTIVSGNYINYRTSVPTASQTRIDAVKNVVDEFITNAVATGVDVNAGFMRHYWGGSVDTTGTPAADNCAVTVDPVEDSGSALGGIMVLPVHPIGDPGFRFFDRMTGTYRTTSFIEALRYKLFDEMVKPSSDSQCPIQLFTPGGRSPIAASMYEALLYFGGFRWNAGNTGKIGQNYDYSSVNESLQLPDNPQSSDFNNNTQYKSPIMDALCAGRNYIVLLSDGTTELDSNSDNTITNVGYQQPTEGLQPFPRYAGGATGKGSCTPDNLDGLQPSDCLDDVADYLATWGIKPPKSPGVPDERGLVKTFTIGLSLTGSPQEAKARDLLKRTAERGRGLYYEASSPEALLDVLNTVLRTVLQDAASFSSPSVAVNAFNRTQNLNELYMSVFEPDFRFRWRGNIKKYKLQPIPDTTTNPETIRFGIYGTDPTVPAVDEETGFFSAAAQSFWTPSAITDGDRVRLGGAASRVPSWDPLAANSRKVYSNLAPTIGGGWILSALGNAVNAVNIPDPATLGKRAADTFVLTQMIDWLRGRDTEDQDADGDRNEARLDMGDPLHGKPAVALYGGTADAPTGYIYLATNDGFLHAINTATGVEAWAFIPADMLGRTRDLMVNRVADPEDRGYGLDGSVRVLRIDRNANGLIEPTDGDKVYLFFGQRRGGTRYYGMDVTSPLAPRLLWSRGRGDTGLEELGDSWSTPTVARVRIGGANCANAFRYDDSSREADDCDVIIVGGGYDSNEDQGLTNSGSTPYVASTRGRAIYMLDAYTGQVRWRAGQTGSGANLQFGAMQYAIPSEVRVLELTNDGFADRMYVGDLGGQLWRFDIVNGQGPATLVQGGILASLGGGDDAEARRFFYPPDVSSSKGWFNVAIGSGHREFPNGDVITQNAFFVVRDRAKLARIATADYPDPPVLFDDLPSVSIDGSTNVGADAPGWKLVFSETGEKVLAESATFDGTVFLSSYTPRPQVSDDGCRIGFGVNKLYTLNVVTASRVDRNDDGVIDDNDATVVELAQGGIAPEPVFVFPSPTSSATTCIGQACRPRPLCLVGLEDCGQGLSNRPVRTYWRQRGVVDAVN